MSARRVAPLVLAATLAITSGCSLRHFATDRLGDALAGGGDVYGSDDDPQLVGDALPFTLKLMESVLAERPRHKPLLLAATRGFTEYAYGWIQQPDGSEIAPAQQERARRMYLRARNYGLRAFEVGAPGFETALRRDPAATVARLTKADVPLLYWTASAWGLAISLSKDDPESVADLPLVEAMIDRALDLDESYGAGAIHDFLISYEPSRAVATGDPHLRSRAHLDRAVELSRGTAASPYVAYAEAVSIETQNKDEFDSMLHSALAVDPKAVPERRLENEIAQRRARWLLAHADDLFLDGATPKSEQHAAAQADAKPKKGDQL